MDGFNGSIMAYGQTTSGKTHTMLGQDGDQGVLVESVQEIFKYMEQNQDSRTINVWASYLEIYNE